MAEVMDTLDRLEINVCLRVNRIGRHRGVKAFFSVISRLGDYGFWLSMGLSLLLIQGSNAVPAVLHMGATAAVCTLLYKLLKSRLVRERPYVTHAGIDCGTPPLDRYSFPSGHTLHAVAFTGMFWFYEPVLLILIAPFTLLVAASRVILGLHYPSDVAVGALLGAALAAVSLALL